MIEKNIAKRHQNKLKQGTGALSHDIGNYPDLINLSLGDPDFTTPEPIISGAFADAKQGQTHYTAGLGQVELREALCADVRDMSIHVDVAQSMITTSACHGMWLVLEALLNEGDEVIVFSPYFSPYKDQIELARGVLVDCPTDASFQIDIEQLNAAISDRTKAIILNSPNNPTGCCYGRETLEKVAEVVKAHDLLVIADDIYTAYAYDAPHVAMASLPEMATRTITVGSFSKNYCMTGWRIGYVLASAPLIQVMESINLGVIYSPPTISQRAALHAIQHKNEVQPPIVNEIRTRMTFMRDALNTLKGIECDVASGGMYLFPRVTGTGMTSAEFTEYVLEKASIRVIDGAVFGQRGDGHVRIALTVGVPVLEEVIGRLKQLPIFA